MENSISQIQADVSSMRGKYKAAVVNRSDSVSPVFSPGESPPGGEGHAVATPKQMHSAGALQQRLQDGRHDLLRSRSVGIRSVVGKSNSTPAPVISTPMSRPKQSARGTVEFPSSDDESDPSWVGERMSTPEPTESGLRQTSRRLEWTPPRSPRNLPPQSLSLSEFEDKVESPESLSTTPPSLLEEAQMHRMVSRLEELFSAQEHRGRLQRLRVAERSSPRTPLSESRYDKLERLTAEESKTSGRTSRAPNTPTMWSASGSDSAFVGLVPPYGEPYSPYARRMAWERPHHVSSTQADTAPTPTLRATFRSSSQKHQQRRKPRKKETKDKRVPKSVSASSASKRERAYPYEGAKTWKESCRVRGPLSRYPLHEAPTSNSVEVGCVKSGGYVEVLRTEIGRGFGSRDETLAMWVLLAQGGWLRVASQFCSPSYGEWLAQGGDGTGLAAPERGPIAVLQTFERPGRGKPFVSSRQSRSGSSKPRGAPTRESTKHSRPFYT